MTKFTQFNNLLIFCFAIVVIFGISVDFAQASSLIDIDLDNVYQPIVEQMKTLLVMLACAFSFVFITSHLLQWVIANPQWANIHNPMVDTGLSFTTSLANMLLIVVFLAIAFGFILKIETFQSKKALPKFFAAAILVQFAPVFVGMIIDIANVANNTLVASGQSSIVSVFNVLSTQILRNVLLFSSWFGVQAAATAIFGVSKAAMGIAIAYFVGFVLPNIPVYLCQISLGFLIGGILGILTLFFVMRVFILQLIAVASPLVVALWPLPQTSRYFKTIFSELIKWAFIGTVALFLLIIGLRSSASIIPQTSFTGKIIGLPFNIQGYIVYYCFLFVFLTTISFIIKKSLPAVGSAIQDTFMGVGGLFMAHAIKPAVGGIAQFAYSFNDQAQQKKIEAEKAGIALSRGENFKANLGSFAANAMSQAVGYMNNPKAPKPEPIIPGATLSRFKKLEEQIQGASAEASLMFVGGADKFAKATLEQKAAIFDKLKDNPAELEKLYIALKAAGKEQEYFNALDALAKKPGMLSKNTLSKVMTTLSPSDRKNLIQNNPNMVKIMLPVGPDGTIKSNREYKTAELAGFQGKDAEIFATQLSMMKELAKTDNKKLKDLNLGEMIKNDPALIAPFVSAFSTNLGQAMGTMKPEERTMIKEFVNKQSDEYLAVHAPHILTLKGKLQKSFQERKSYNSDPRDDDEKQTTLRQNYTKLSANDRRPK